jgi:hypothetical protein
LEISTKRVPKGYLSQKQKKILRKEIMETQVDRKGPKKKKKEEEEEEEGQEKKTK